MASGISSKGGGGGGGVGLVVVQAKGQTVKLIGVLEEVDSAPIMHDPESAFDGPPELVGVAEAGVRFGDEQVGATEPSEGIPEVRSKDLRDNGQHG